VSNLEIQHVVIALKPQHQRLMDLIDVYTGLMAPDIAAERMGRLRKAGLDNITFAWAGSIERGQVGVQRIWRMPLRQSI